MASADIVMAGFGAALTLRSLLEFLDLTRYTILPNTAGCFTADDRVIESVTDPEECVRLGADAIAIAIGIFGPNEGRFIKILMDGVARAAIRQLWAESRGETPEDEGLGED